MEKSIVVVVPKTSSRLPSLSMDKMSIYSQQESWPINANLAPINSVSTTNKSLDHLDQHLSTSTHPKMPTKHFSTPSLGEISTDSEVFQNAASIVPSLSIDTNEHLETKDWSVDQCIQWLTAQQLTPLISLFLTRNINGEKLLLLDSTKMKVCVAFTIEDRLHRLLLLLLGNGHQIQSRS